MLSKISFVLLLFVLSFTHLSHSQTLVTGKLIDQDKEPIAFATVILKEHNAFANTKLDGTFKLRTHTRIKRSDTLEIRFVGFESVKIALNPNQLNIGTIVLKKENRLLTEVAVKAPPPVEEIIDLMYDNIPLNYSDTQQYLTGFYREVLTEGDKCIEVNEAVLGIDYGKYPIKRGKFSPFGKNKYSKVNKSLSNFLGRRSGQIFTFASYFPDYTVNDDAIYLIEGRESYNHSIYGNYATAECGPNDLLAQDKLKYNYDFLNPTNKSLYAYKNKGKVVKNGVVCYEISFNVIPHDELKAIDRIPELDLLNIRWSKEKKAEYNGFLYVSVKDYALVEYSCQFYKVYKFMTASGTHWDFGFPDLINISVSYKKNEQGKYGLDEMEIFQSINETFNKKIVNYTSTRSLQFYKSTEEVGNKQQELEYTNGVTIRDYINTYNHDYWQKFESSTNYKSLDRKQIADLEIKRTLEKQFLELNLSIAEMEIPNVTAIAKTLSNTPVKKDYFYQMKSDYDSLLTDYLKIENDYYSAVLNKMALNKLAYIKATRNIWNADFFKVKYDTVKHDFFMYDGRKLCIEPDSTGHDVVYNYDTKKAIVDLDKLEEGKVNFIYGNASFKGDNYLGITYSVKGEMAYHLVVKDYNKDEFIFHEEFVGNYYWLNDTVIIYTHADSTYRANEVRLANVETGVIRTINKLDDPIYSLSLVETDMQLLLYQSSHDQNLVSVYDTLSNTFSELFMPAKNVYFEPCRIRNDSIYYLKNGEQSKLMLRIGSKAPYAESQIYQTDGFVEDVKFAKDFILFTEYDKGSYELKKIDKKTKKLSVINNFQKYSYIVMDSISDTTNMVTVQVSSPINKPEQLKINLVTEKMDTIAPVRINKAYLPENYTYKYFFVAAEYGEKIPVTILYNKIYKDSLKGMLINGYGAYGARNTPGFSPENLIYANNGMCIVYVFPRGSSEKGNEWYQNGKLLHKKNTFTDFIACTKFLKEKYQFSQHQILAKGGSAGGLLMGAIANMEPDLYGGIILDRPAIDVIGFMGNPKLPLTTGEYNEWGDIRNEVYYDYVASYSPLGNIKKQNYPNLLLLGKYNDMHTPYWDIAEATIKYRQSALNNPLILFNTNFEAGHFGNADSNVQLEYNAAVFAFVMYTIKHP